MLLALETIYYIVHAFKGLELYNQIKKVDSEIEI